MTKTCSKCNNIKLKIEFKKSKTTKDKLEARCKSCVKEYRREYYNKNRCRILKEQVKYNKTRKHEKREYDKLYRELHKNHIQKLKQSWIKNNRIRYNKTQNINWRKRRALKQKIKEQYTQKDEEYTKQLFNHKCANCGSTDNLCIDHHKPLSKGYALTRENAVLLCRYCNCAKGNKLPEYFYTSSVLCYITSLLIS